MLHVPSTFILSRIAPFGKLRIELTLNVLLIVQIDLVAPIALLISPQAVVAAP